MKEEKELKDLLKKATKPPFKPTIVTDGGPWAQHDMPCAVHGDERAVIELGSGIFLPSWKAQKEGWMLIKVPRFLKRFLRRYTPGYLKG